MRQLVVALQDDSLYAALEAEAARRQQSLDGVVAEALADWLESLADVDLLPSLEAAHLEWEREGGVEADRFFRQLREEPDPPDAP